MAHPEKATVHYSTLIPPDYKVYEGTGVVLVPVDHTSPFVTNGEPAVTSAVTRVGDNGEFETKNTIYKPVA